MTEQPCEKACDNNTDGGQKYRLNGNSLCTLPVGAKAAIEHDKNQRGRAYLFSERVIVEIYLHYSVRAKSMPSTIKAKSAGMPMRLETRFSRIHKKITIDVMSRYVFMESSFIKW